MRCRDEVEGGRTILLLPGFCSPPEVLHPLGRRLERRLERPTLALSLGFAWGDIRDLAERAHDAIETLVARGRVSRRVDVVGHSMGGIVAAYLLKCLDQGRRVRRVVTLGTPHRGIASARVGHLLPGPVGRTMRQLRPGSPLLALLSRMKLPDRCALVSIGGLDDAVVPSPATRLPDDVTGERGILLAGVDHLGLVFSRRACDALIRALTAAPESAAPQASAAASARHERIPSVGRRRKAWPGEETRGRHQSRTPAAASLP